MSTISRSDVAYVAGLAQLDMDEAATERLVAEMNSKVTPSLPRELALRGAPTHDDEYFTVPKILDAEGGGA